MRDIDDRIQMNSAPVLGGRYELRGVLGRGGMAEVHEAWDGRLCRVVAVKLLRVGFSHQPDELERFQAEARSAAALNHPNIICVHDTGEHHGTPYIVMERLPGPSLADHIAQGPLSQTLVRTVLSEVLAALAAAHDAGILHRDVKPANIMFTSTGGVKLTDFGIAKCGEVGYTATGQIMGTMAYLSPDRLLGKPAVAADDLYAVGVAAYEALTGRRPFPQNNMGVLARAILHEQPPPLAALRPDVAPELAAVIERAMSRDPAQRFTSARQMRDALSQPPPGRPVGSGTRVLTAPVPPPTEVPVAAVPAAAVRRSGRAGRVFLVAVAAAAVLLALILMVAESATRPDTSEPATTSTPVAPPPPPTSPSSSAPTTAAPEPPVPQEPPGPRQGPKPKKPKGPGRP